MRADWQDLLGQMDEIQRRAIEVQGHLRNVAAVVQTTAAAVDASASAVTASLATLGSSVSTAQTDVSASLSTIQESAASAVGFVGSSTSQMSAQVQQAAADVAASATSMATSTETAHKQVATRLDDLQQLLSDHDNLWNKGVDEMIDAVKIGAVPIEELLRLYGDAIVQGKRVRDFLSGLDLRQYVHQVDDLAKGLYDGTVKISQVTDFLGSTQLLFAKQMADTIKLFQEGKVTLEYVESIIAGIKKLFPIGEFADLAKALEDALRKGHL